LLGNIATMLTGRALCCIARLVCCHNVDTTKVPENGRNVVLQIDEILECLGKYVLYNCLAELFTTYCFYFCSVEACQICPIYTIQIMS